MRWRYLITAFALVHFGLPRLEGLPDRLYREGGPQVRQLALLVRSLDLEEVLAQLRLPAFTQPSQIERLRRQPPPPVPVRVPSTARREALVAEAIRYLGTPYVFGGEGEYGIDCSALIRNVFASQHIALPRTAARQFHYGRAIAAAEMKPGDLIFFETWKPGPSHVGIYLGDNIFIHASSGSQRVTTARFSQAYYQHRYVGSRRIL